MEDSNSGRWIIISDEWYPQASVAGAKREMERSRKKSKNGNPSSQIPSPSLFSPSLPFPYSLRSKRSQSSYSAIVRAGAKKKNRRGRGGGGGEGRRGNAVSFAPFPLPPHSFFLLSSHLSRRTRAETLAMQANFDTPTPGTHASYPLTL